MAMVTIARFVGLIERALILGVSNATTKEVDTALKKIESEKTEERDLTVSRWSGDQRQF